MRAPRPWSRSSECLITPCVRASSSRISSRSATISGERRGFLDWLGAQLGVRVETLAGHTTLLRYDEIAIPEMLATLRSNRARLRRDPDARDFVETLDRERAASLERLGEASGALLEAERQADRLVYELYELTADQRAIIDADYRTTG